MLFMLIGKLEISLLPPPHSKSHYLEDVIPSGLKGKDHFSFSLDVDSACDVSLFFN